MNKLGSLFDVLPEALCICWRIIVWFDWVHIFAEVANPFLTWFNEFDEGIDVGTTVFAPDDWFVVEVGARNRLAWRQLTIRFHYDCEGDRCFLCLLGCGRDSISGDPQEWLVRVKIIHSFALERSHIMSLRLWDIRGPLWLLQFSILTVEGAYINDWLGNWFWGRGHIVMALHRVCSILSPIVVVVLGGLRMAEGIGSGRLASLGACRHRKRISGWPLSTLLVLGLWVRGWCEVLIWHVVVPLLSVLDLLGWRISVHLIFKIS